MKYSHIDLSHVEEKSAGTICGGKHACSEKHFDPNDPQCRECELDSQQAIDELSTRRRKRKMKRWEYKELRVRCDRKIRALNGLGKKGWECYGIDVHGISAPGEPEYCTLHMKRSIIPGPVLLEKDNG